MAPILKVTGCGVGTVLPANWRNCSRNNPPNSMTRSLLAPLSKMTNSSPPRRAANERSGSTVRIISLKAISKRSPAICPCRSLTSLKLSMSISSKAPGCAGLTSLKKCPARTSSARRLYKAVNGSRAASRAIRSSRR
ncbi:hypothetical protein D3C79_882320 [compost metagenome]